MERGNPTSDVGAGFKPARARASEELRHPITESPHEPVP